MKQVFARHGDLLFIKTDKKAENKPTKSLTIAEGEFTGHHHVLLVEAKGSIKGSKTHFTVTGKAKLTHPEHGVIPFPEGNYMVITEREHDYINNELVKVRD